MANPIVVDIPKEIGSTRYNGGWLKSVTGLDKTHNDGYSILGDFKRGTGADSLQPGLYLDCDIRGSRKNNEKFYTLVELKADGSVETLGGADGVSGYDRGQSGRDWAVKLWPPIGAYFARVEAAEIDYNALTAEQQALVARIAEIDAILASWEATAGDADVSESA